MKKLIALLIPVLFVAACKNVEQFRAPIEALSADWEKATTSVTEIGGMIGAAQSSLNSLKDSLVVDPAKAAKMKPEMTAALDSMRSAFNGHVEGITGLASEVTGFATSWEEMSKKLATLKEGLEQQKKTYEEKTLEAIKILENASGLTEMEAKDLMLKKIKEDSRAEISSIFRKKYKLAEQNVKNENNERLPTWGLIAAALGNSSNKSSFANAFFKESLLS